MIHWSSLVCLSKYPTAKHLWIGHAVATVGGCTWKTEILCVKI